MVKTLAKSIKMFSLLFVSIASSSCVGKSEKITLPPGYFSEAKLIFLESNGERFCRTKVTFEQVELISVLEKIWTDREGFNFFVSGAHVDQKGISTLEVFSPEICSIAGIK